MGNPPARARIRTENFLVARGPPGADPLHHCVLAVWFPTVDTLAEDGETRSGENHEDVMDESSTLKHGRSPDAYPLQCGKHMCPAKFQARELDTLTLVFRFMSASNLRLPAGPEDAGGMWGREHSAALHTQAPSHSAVAAVEN